LRLFGLATSALLTDPPPGWPEVRIEWRELSGGPPDETIEDGRVSVGLLDGGHLVLDRESRTATYLTRAHTDGTELVHPHLSGVASVFGSWLGRRALHAGAFAFEGRAWAVLGEAEAGKSTLLTALHQQGHPVLADDMLIVDGAKALAGPRCIDLRTPAADRLGVEEDLSPARHGTRQRLALPQVDGETPFAGWISLGWGDRAEIRRLSAGERLRRLASQRRGLAVLQDPQGLLELASLPALELRRPRRFDLLLPAIRRMLHTIAG
jgi:hypothetical protein